MAVQRIIQNIFFHALTFHYVYGIVEYAFHDEMARLSHQHSCAGKVAQRDGQRAAMIVMTMRERNGLHIGIGHLRIAWQSLASFHARMRASIEQHRMPARFNEPRAGADGVGGVKIGHTHRGSLMT